MDTSSPRCGPGNWSGDRRAQAQAPQAIHNATDIVADAAPRRLSAEESPHISPDYRRRREITVALRGAWTSRAEQAGRREVPGGGPLNSPLSPAQPLKRVT